MAPLLEISDLQIRFPAAEAVRGLSLHIDQGEVLGLVGESGSGKSVTALAIMGLLGPAARVAGQIAWRGRAGCADSIDLLRQPQSALQRCSCDLVARRRLAQRSSPGRNSVITSNIMCAGLTCTTRQWPPLAVVEFGTRPV